MKWRSTYIETKIFSIVVALFLGFQLNRNVIEIFPFFINFHLLIYVNN